MNHVVPLRIIKKYMSPLVRVEERLHFKKGQTLFYKGHRAYGLYMVRSGKVALVEKREGSKNTIKRILGPGDIFGDQALTHHAPYDLSAMALEDCQIIFYPKSILNFDHTGSHSSHRLKLSA